MVYPIEVRPARPEEYGEVGDLLVRVYADEGWGSGDYLEVLRDVAGRAEQAEVLVAVEGDVLLGSVTVATRGGPAAEQAGPGEAVVRMLVTGPAARRRGTGTALVAACLEAARRDGCTRVRLSTQRGMASAHRVYERFGFTRTPEADWEPEPGLTLLTYALDLPASCVVCGEPGTHPGCEARRALEPPRYCARCRRRMVVQVTPTGWTARCVEHGVTSG